MEAFVLLRSKTLQDQNKIVELEAKKISGNANSELTNRISKIDELAKYQGHILEECMNKKHDLELQLQKT